MTRPRVPLLHLIGPPACVSASTYRSIFTRISLTENVAVHCRMPGAPAAEVLSLAGELRDGVGPARLIVNDRLDVAQIVRADGVQLGECGIPVHAARSLLGPDCLIGRSIHDANGAITAEAHGADYLIAGHVFATPSKPGSAGRGLAWLREVTGSIAILVIAIGGITLDRIETVLAAGAVGIAVLSPLADPDVKGLLAKLLERIEREQGVSRHEHNA